MCGIAAFSIPDNVRVNAREMAHALLSQIETRGSHASGFAYRTSAGVSGVYKNPKPGSQLSLAELPRDAKTVILHTRFATQGSTEDNRNNHPVMSPDNTIALVHNGVISNDHLLRERLGVTAEHGEVDSLVIPAAILKDGVEGLGKLAGYAAIAWISSDEEGELHIARLKSSPVAYTHLADGTFVMASQPRLLTEALDQIDALYGGVFEMSEKTMMSVHQGFIYANGASPAMTYSQSTYNRYSGATSGGHTVTQLRGATKGSEDVKQVVFKADGDGEAEVIDIEQYRKDLDEWQKRSTARDAELQSRAMAAMADEDWDYSDLENAATKSPDDWTDEDWEDLIASMKDDEDGDDDEALDIPEGEGFYILDAEGDVSHHPSLDDLERRLHWLAQMHRNEFDMFQDIDDNINWVNHIMDIGSVGKKGTLFSWVEDSAEIDLFESPAVRNLQYVREGVGLLERLKGA